MLEPQDSWQDSLPLVGLGLIMSLKNESLKFKKLTQRCQWLCRVMTLGYTQNLVFTDLPISDHNYFSSQIFAETWKGKNNKNTCMWMFECWMVHVYYITNDNQILMVHRKYKEFKFVKIFGTYIDYGFWVRRVWIFLFWTEHDHSLMTS